MKTEVYHILNGDSLLQKFPNEKIQGELIVCRECLIEGPVTAGDLDTFCQQRAGYIQKIYGEKTEDYNKRVRDEFDKVLKIPEGSEVNLWFENDLFCQANMWFVISILVNKDVNLNRVFPQVKNPVDIWKGFGISDSTELIKAYGKKVKFSSQDKQLGYDLWKAYQKNDPLKLNKLSLTKSDCFEYLEEVCTAHIQRSSGKGLGRPELTLKSIIESGQKDFNKVFSEFFQKDGIYGFGDTQVKQLLKKNLIHN